MRLDFFDLQLFINILSTGSLTKGAERSAISLQAASERIKKLEQHFEVSLFTRHATGVKATLAGQTFAEQAALAATTAAITTSHAALCAQCNEQHYIVVQLIGAE